MFKVIKQVKNTAKMMDIKSFKCNVKKFEI